MRFDDGGCIQYVFGMVGEYVDEESGVVKKALI
jgi:hypothetical protein